MSEPDKYELPERVIVRGYPKSIYLWPSMLTGFILWLIDFALDAMDQYPANQQEFQAYLASAWIIILTFNIIVISFDFSLGKTFTIFVTLALIIVLYLVFKEALFPEGIGLDIQLKQTLVDFDIGASPNFYLLISIILFIIFLVVFINSRFNYWEFESNRIIHHNGIFEREESFSAQNSRVITRTDDIFERILFRAGTIFIIDPEKKVHEITNVYNAVNKDKIIQDLLSVVRVRED
ncbi:MAG: hypothetical protein ACXAC7_18120 [Candidatus Hodarchaeales archaeon]|jgi:membrane protein YdbS with pleckstrin-like domain